MQADVTLDCFGLLCPMPIIKAAEKVKELKKGQVLEVLSTDEGIKTDLPAWCKATGNEYLGVEEKAGQYRAYLRKTTGGD
jgi:TusA-related sulfurtransferase